MECLSVLLAWHAGEGGVEWKRYLRPVAVSTLNPSSNGRDADQYQMLPR
jgi:hypothetical protein